MNSLTSKEDLQSLNEELTALNGQLKEALWRQLSTSNDLKNVLYSTDVATLFLDADLNIRFFTPAIQALFRIIPGDIGRPLSDLNALAGDSGLPEDARTVLGQSAAIERDIQIPGGVWFRRRILPYFSDDHLVEGIVITFTDITETKKVTGAQEAAKRQAELATIAKSRFLAAASHDLRQPLQTLVLLQGLLVRSAKSDEARHLLGRMDRNLVSMAGMLDTLLEIKQIEYGVVKPDLTDFGIDGLLAQMEEEFADQALSQKLSWRRAFCSLQVRSDRKMLGQILRNLIANALKYTEHGGVLIGCRRRGDVLRIGVWDTGLGIADGEIEAIFEDYHQVGNVAHESRLGVGLGLSIVRRLAELLGHTVHVSSVFGRGSVFAIDVAIANGCDHPERASPFSTPHSPAPTGVLPKAQRAEPVDFAEALTESGPAGPAGTPRDDRSRPGIVYVVDDDPDVLEAIRNVVEADGRNVRTYGDGAAFLADLDPGHGDCLLLDARMPGLGGMAILSILHMRGLHLPTIMITGHGDVPMAVAAMQAGAFDLIEKPIGGELLLARIDSALAHAVDAEKITARREAAKSQINGLTMRQHQIMDLVLAGHPSKNIAVDLGISQRTVENHRAAIMARTGSKSLPDLARLAVTAAIDGVQATG